MNESIAKWYQHEYDLSDIGVVKNVPITQYDGPMRLNLLRQTFGLSDNDIIFIYQGAISSDRGIMLLLKVFSRLSREKHIVLLGFGELTDRVKEYALKYSNIHYLPAVSPYDIRKYTSSADIGVHLIENTCLNHYYCLPNKIWEYLDAGIPILVSDFPEMGKVVDLFHCGWKCNAFEDAIVKLVEQITPKSIAQKRECAISSRKYFGWHMEESKLLRVYGKLGFKKII